MRPATVYGCLLLGCIVFSFAEAEKKLKYDDTTLDNRKNNKNGIEENKDTKYSGKKLVTNSEELERVGKNFGNSAASFRGKPVKQDAEENTTNKKETTRGNNNKEPKRFIGRIEHGKVKVLKSKSDKVRNGGDDSEEVCRKSHGNGCNENFADDSDENKPMKKIKYSIKFQHEKQKKKENNDDISIMRLHKNGRKKYGRDDDDDDSSEEDDRPIKRFHFMEDDD